MQVDHDLRWPGQGVSAPQSSDRYHREPEIRSHRRGDGESNLGRRFTRESAAPRRGRQKFYQDRLSWHITALCAEMVTRLTSGVVRRVEGSYGSHKGADLL